MGPSWTIKPCLFTDSSHKDYSSSSTQGLNMWRDRTEQRVEGREKWGLRRWEAVEGLELQNNGWGFSVALLATPGQAMLRWFAFPFPAQFCSNEPPPEQSQSEPGPLFVAANWISATQDFVSLLVWTVRLLLYFTALSGLISAGRITVGETDNHTFLHIGAKRRITK